MFTVTNAPGTEPHSGRSFTVRIVRPGEHYGRDDVLVNTGQQDLVEFYDLTYTEKFGPRGQFVSRYNLGTLAPRWDEPPMGLLLDGGVPPWRLDAPAMAAVLDGLWAELGARL